jgi:hypothetical protein
MIAILRPEPIDVANFLPDVKVLQRVEFLLVGLELEGVVILGSGGSGIGGFEDDETTSLVPEGKEFP